MSPSPSPSLGKKEHPHTYIVQNHNVEEITRLDLQDRLITRCMGQVLPEQPDQTCFQHVLDVGCGAGWWLIEVARTYPGIPKLVGVDINKHFVDHAHQLAQEAQVSNRVHFQAGDALRMLEFSDHFFDLVNHRFAMSFLRKWDWPRLLREYQRVCRLAGVIRVTEASLPESNSPALTQLLDLLFQAMCQLGYFFTPTRDGVISHLAALLTRYGIEKVQTHTHPLTFRDPEAKQIFALDCQYAFRTTIPFLRKYTKFPYNYEDLYQQMIYETRQPDWEISMTIVTAWGKNHIRHP